MSQNRHKWIDLPAKTSTQICQNCSLVRRRLVSRPLPRRRSSPRWVYLVDGQEHIGEVPACGPPDDPDFLLYAFIKTGEALKEKDDIRAHETPAIIEACVGLEIELNRIHWALAKALDHRTINNH